MHNRVGRGYMEKAVQDTEGFGSVKGLNKHIEWLFACI
jgi:hypothetical protein